MPLITSDFFNVHMEQLGLKASFSPKAEQLDELIVEASDWVEDYCRRHLESASRIEVLRGSGYNRLILDDWPATALTTVTWEEGGSSTGSESTSDLRLLTSGILEFKDSIKGPWRPSRLYTVTYTAGYNPIPSLVKRATALKVVDLFSPMYQGPREKRAVELVTNIEEMIADLLEKYRRDRMG